MNINQLLSKAILDSKIPITRLAERSRVSRQHIYSIMRNEKNVSSETLTSLCKAMNISVSALFEGKIEKPKGIKIPVLGSIPAGTPIEAVQDIIDYEEISQEMASSGEYFGLKVSGDSMSPVIQDGDTVIIRKQESADTGKICVVMVNGFDATLKEIKREENGIWVLPKNPNCDFKPTFYTNNEIENLPIRILGVVVELRRSF